MPAGPGKYDKECTRLRLATNARGAIVIVIGGDKGNGFSVQADLQTSMDLPEVLERMAFEIREGVADAAQ